LIDVTVKLFIVRDVQFVKTITL